MSIFCSNLMKQSFDADKLITFKVIQSGKMGMITKLALKCLGASNQKFDLLSGPFKSIVISEYIDTPPLHT